MAMPRAVAKAANMTDWLWPLMGGLLTATLAGPLGSLLLWRRMAYFGDSLAHASLLGIALAVLLDQPMGLWVALSCLGTGLLLSRLMTLPEHGADTWLAILAYSGLSLALLISAWQGSDGHALEDYLFGDLQTLDGATLKVMLPGLLLIALLLWRSWPGLVALAVDEEMAQVDGWPVRRLRPLLMLMLAGVVAAGAKVMGVLLISALLVVPAAAARYVARTPGQMALRASLIGQIAVLAGCGLGLPAALPVAPLIVLSALGLLFALMAWQRLRA